MGGAFELIDTDGKPFTDKKLLGEFALIYFGFTFCPDICPDELEKIAAAVDAVEKQVRGVGARGSATRVAVQSLLSVMAYKL